MSLILATILISAAVVIVSGEPTILALNPNFLTAKHLLPVDNFLPEPYEFGYQVADGLGMSQHRQEVSDSSGAVKGSYGYIDPLGVQRLVEYTADKDGYKAVVKSNEPGMAGHGQSSANTLFVVETPPPAAIAQGLKPILVNSLQTVL